MLHVNLSIYISKSTPKSYDIVPQNEIFDTGIAFSKKVSSLLRYISCSFPSQASVSHGQEL